MLMIIPRRYFRYRPIRLLLPNNNRHPNPQQRATTTNEHAMRIMRMVIIRILTRRKDMIMTTMTIITTSLRSNTRCMNACLQFKGALFSVPLFRAWSRPCHALNNLISFFVFLDLTIFHSQCLDPFSIG
jgi:hypothetical protein